MFTAIEDEKPQTKHVVSLRCYFVHFGGIVSATDVNDFKSKFAPKKWKQKFQELVGVGTSLEHNHECYVKGAECQGDPKAIFRFVSAVKASSKVIKAMVLKHEANDAYKNLPPNEKYDGHVGDVGDTATHLLKNYSATVGPVKGKSTVIAAEYVVVRTILELCGAGLIDLDSDLGIGHSLGVNRKSLCFFFLCFCASDYTWSHAKRRISSMRIDTAIEVKWKSSSSGGVVEAHTCPCATHIGQVSCCDAAQLVTIKVGAAGIGQNGRSATFYKKLKAPEVTEVVARHFPLIHGSFMPLLGRKKEVAGASDRRKYRRGVPVITPMSFTYKKEVTEVKQQRSTPKKKTGSWQAHRDPHSWVLVPTSKEIENEWPPPRD